MDLRDYLLDRLPYGAAGFLAIALSALHPGTYVMAVIAGIVFSGFLVGLFTLTWAAHRWCERRQIRRQFPRLSGPRRQAF